MSLLDQLWDDTVAGPRPETGLGKLRKQFRPNTSGKDLNVRAGGENASEEAVKITRSIMIMKPPSSPNQGDQTGTPPASPAGSTPPISPLSGGGGFRFRRRSTSDAYEKTSGIGSRSPRPPYDM
ncbi:dormancy-associated protein-like [Heracleum sosnowskyi]|uniref:Dormancy-associated protein-like n=1 Tax=Heracleum sosnowskyi TaxID=360622 RepID=A0AAD8JDF0_9APIA|nr:dormancy-associated protein-like [Heracleum sosnowskyi]